MRSHLLYGYNQAGGSFQADPLSRIIERNGTAYAYHSDGNTAHFVELGLGARSIFRGSAAWHG